MSNISFYFKKFLPHVIKRSIISPELNYLMGIQIIDENTDINSLSDSFLYIGEGKAIERVIRNYENDTVISLFSAGTTSYLDSIDRKENINYVITDYPLISLYNNVNSVMVRYQSWDHHITNAVYEEQGIDYLLKISSNFLEAHVILLNSGYHVVSSSYTESFNSKFATEAKFSEYLCYNSVLTLESYLDKCEIRPKNIFIFTPDFEDTRIYVKRIKFDDLTVSTLLIITKDVDYDYDITRMINHMGSMVKTIYTQQTPDETFSESDKLSCLISDIHSRDNISSHEIIDRLNNLTYKLKSFLRCIVINFNNYKDDIPFEDFMRKISFIFTGCNIALYKKTVIILYSTNEKTYQIPDVLYNSDFNNILEQYNAIAVVSNSIRHFDKFRSLYYLCRRLGKILRAMSFKNNPYGRVFPYDEYSIYVSIDFASAQFQNSLSSDDIILLADPAIVSLSRYDNEHNTNLCDVLLSYLASGRNITTTAKELYMHRNTIQNKIAKISSIISLDLTDGHVQQRLLYSCQVIKYYEEFIKARIV